MINQIYKQINLKQQVTKHQSVCRLNLKMLLSCHLGDTTRSFLQLVPRTASQHSRSFLEMSMFNWTKMMGFEISMFMIVSRNVWFKITICSNLLDTNEIYVSLIWFWRWFKILKVYQGFANSNRSVNKSMIPQFEEIPFSWNSPYPQNELDKDWFNKSPTHKLCACVTPSFGDIAREPVEKKVIPSL